MRLGKIIELPVVVNGPPIPPLDLKDVQTEGEIINNILQLAWDDIEAFLTLEASCISWKPIAISEKVRGVLRGLNLINEKGIPPIKVREVMKTIANFQRKNMM